MKNLPKYFICDAFTNKGTFLNCLYKYVSYTERYVVSLDETYKEVQVEKEGCFHIIRECSPEELTKYKS